MVAGFEVRGARGLDPRRAAPALAVAAATLLVAGLLAASVQGGLGRRLASVGTSRTVPEAGDAISAPPATAAPTPPDQLAALALAPPPNFTAVPAGTPGIGPLDLETLAGLHADRAGAERMLLRRSGFRAGYGHSWVDAASGDAIFAFVLEFGDDGGAGDYLDHSILAAKLDPAFRQAGEPGIPGAVAFEGTDARGLVDFALFRKGRHCWVMGLWRPGGEHASALVAQLARAQWERA